MDVNTIKYIFITSIALLLVSSCVKNSKEYENEISFSINDFQKIIELKSEVILSDDTVYRPNRLYLYDSIMITKEIGSKYAFHIYNLNTQSRIGESIMIGQGPNEVLVAYIVESQLSKEAVLVLDIATQKVLFFNLNDLITENAPTPFKRIDMSSDKIVFLEDMIVGNNSFGSQYNLNFYDLEGKLIESKAELPKYKSNNSNISNHIVFQGNLTVGNNRIFYVYYFTDLIDIYDLKGGLLKRIHGPDNFLPEMEYSEVGSRPTKKSRDAYYCPVFADGELFVAYNGLFQKDYIETVDQILVFDSNGNPLRRYILDKRIISFTVDTQNQIIYAICRDPEYHVIKFKY